MRLQHGLDDVDQLATLRANLMESQLPRRLQVTFVGDHLVGIGARREELLDLPRVRRDGRPRTGSRRHCLYGQLLDAPGRLHQLLAELGEAPPGGAGVQARSSSVTQVITGSLGPRERTRIAHRL